MTTPPKVFRVNWFRTDARGKFIWPGFGENLRVVKWIFERCDGVGKGKETPIGIVPTPDAIDQTGLDDLERGDGNARRRRARRLGGGVGDQATFFKSLGSRVPHEMFEEQKRLADALGGSA